MSKKLIMLEFNELCPHLMSRFIEAGKLPNFKKLYDSSIVRKTDANATGEDLNPWVQWVDLHTGLNFKEHGLYKLNQAGGFKGKFTWDVLAERFGVKSWISGSMNAGYSDTFVGRFLPDPWTVNVTPFPEGHMDKYYSYVSQAVQGHSSQGRNPVSSTQFVKSLLKQGISSFTIIKLIIQLTKEKVLSAADSWERAMLLDWIQYDLFKYYYKKESPEFSTFFSNCVAHYQHHYWKDYEPELFDDEKYTPDSRKSGAILRAYQNSDAIVGKIMQFVDSETAILLVTALSQKPYTKNKRYYYHISSEQEFRAQFKMPDSIAYKPVMANQFHLEAQSEEQARSYAKILQSYDMDSNQYFHEGSNQLFLVTQEGNIIDAQCRATRDVKDDAQFVDNRTNTRYSFYDHFYKMTENKTGVHDPVGLYWFRHPMKEPQVNEDSCPPDQVHRDVISYFGAV